MNASERLSQGAEQLIREIELHAASRHAAEPLFDVVIVGSGYGGAVAAARLASATEHGRPLRICVLERGREFVTGEFPERFADLIGEVRLNWHDDPAPRGRREGLFDLRLGKTVAALVGNGLGGGSLINAGVLAEPAHEVFQREPWPAELRDPARLAPYFARAKQMLGAAKVPQRKPAKLQALEAVAHALQPHARDVDRRAEIAVSFTGGVNPQGVAQNPCNRCGDCFTGCNHGAKNTLPNNYLAAARAGGVRLFTGVTVLSLARAAGGWQVDLTVTSSETAERIARKRAQRPELASSPADVAPLAPIALLAGRVILAAGTFGSTEILLRSKERGLSLSAERLGKRFSTNGDMISVGYRMRAYVNASAKENDAPDQRDVGPTITGIVDLRNDARHPGVVIEEMAVPGALRRLFEETITTAAALHRLARTDWSRHSSTAAGQDVAAIDQEAVAQTAVYASMGDDGAQGRLELVPPARAASAAQSTTPADGAITVHWPEVASHPVFERCMRALRAAHAHEDVGGTLIPYPLWQPLPEALLSFIDNPAGGGSVVTVHPLGGCAMGDRAEQGVVNHLGQVFSGSSGRDVYPGLVVLDGSIIASALGINPCLTIAALAERSVAELIGLWGLKRDATIMRPAPGPHERLPRILPPPPVRNAQRRSTAVRLAERLEGPLDLPQADGTREGQRLHGDLYLVYRPIQDLFGFTAALPKQIEFESATLRLCRDTHKVAEVHLDGTFSLLQREDSWPLQRICRATWAWWLNRGRYDMWRRKPSLAGLATLWKMLVALLRLNSHAGEARQFVYQFVVRADVELDGAVILRHGDRLIGRKHIAYVRGANLWQQLMNLEMTLVSQRHLSGTRVGNLVVNLSWFAKEHAAQLQLVDQENQPEAIADLLSFFAYVVRVMVGVHFWSLRLPDYPKDSLPLEAFAPEPPSPYPYAEASGVTHKYAFHDQLSGTLRVTGSRVEYEQAVQQAPAALHTCERRLPPELPGLVRERYAVALPTRLPNVRAGFEPATMLLTRYRRPGQSAIYPPVLMLHGYGAGGTTFALDTVQQNLVQHLAGLGFDVWVADLRTSIGLQTSVRQWVFEDIAYVDIPVAIEFVLQEALQPALHIVAHCVGAATFSMACLSGLVNPASILSAVLSQVGPLVEMPDMNRFRGYLAGYLKDYLDWDLLDITEARRPFVELIDRVLATYPFAKSEAPGESDEHAHVPAPSWRRIPHEAWCNRASAIFGPLYRHANLNQATLDNLGSLLGHVNFKTFQQTIFYATRGRITDHLGENPYVNGEALKQFFSFPVRFIHGAHNQVFHPEGSRRCAALLSAVFPSTVVGHNHVSCVVIENYGHQDCLIGANAHADVYGTISKFLLLHPRVDLRAALERDVDVLRAPRVGPVLGWLRWRAQTQTQPEAPIARLMFVPDTRSSPPSHAMTLVLCGDGRLCNGFARSHPLQRVETAGLLPAATQQLPALKPLAATQVLDIELPPQPGDYRIVVLTLHAEPGPPEAGDPGRVVEAVQGQRLRSIAKALADPHWHDMLPDAWAQRILAACPDDEVRGAMRAAWRVADLDYQRSTAVAHVGARVLAAAGHADAQAGPTLQVPFAFAVGSCRYAATPLDREQADASFGRLRELLALAPPERLCPQLLLLVGDQIYADATAGLFDASGDFDRYDARYREAWTAPNAREVLRRLPTYMMLDDHEIRNNVERDPRTQRSAAVAFESYQRGLAPHNPHHDPRSGKFAYWYAFDAGGCGFFVADTRTDRRRAPDASCLEDAIIGETQQAELFAWLRAQQERHPDRPKFVVCPSVVLPLSRGTGGSPAYALRSDGWDGFPSSLARILDWIARHRIGQVVFVSGDFHCSLASEVRLKHQDSDAVTTVHSIVASGLYAPYPFANSKPRDVQQRFKGTLGEWYGIAGDDRLDALVIDYDIRMSVHDDSFALLGVRDDPEREGGLRLEVEFDSRAGVSRTSFALR